MDLSKLRALIAQAREQAGNIAREPWTETEDLSESPGWMTVEDGEGMLVLPSAADSEAAWIVAARSREPLLARVLDAALEVVEAAALYDAKSVDEEDNALDEAYIALADSLSRFRAALEQEA